MLRQTSVTKLNPHSLTCRNCDVGSINNQAASQPDCVNLFLDQASQHLGGCLKIVSPSSTQVDFGLRGCLMRDTFLK
jgi:hypothetical protein